MPGNRPIFASEKGNKFKSNTLKKGISKGIILRVLKIERITNYNRVTIYN